MYYHCEKYWTNCDILERHRDNLILTTPPHDFTTLIVLFYTRQCVFVHFFFRCFSISVLTPDSVTPKEPTCTEYERKGLYKTQWAIKTQFRPVTTNWSWRGPLSEPNEITSFSNPSQSLYPYIVNRKLILNILVMFEQTGISSSKEMLKTKPFPDLPHLPSPSLLKCHK